MHPPLRLAECDQQVKQYRFIHSSHFIFRLITIVSILDINLNNVYLLIGSGLHIDRSAGEPVSMEGYVEEGLLGLSSEVEGRILSSSVTRDLLCLERCTPVTSQSVNPLVTSVKTPLHFRAWERALAQHPDGEFAGYVLRGIAEGFWIGYSGAS